MITYKIETFLQRFEEGKVTLFWNNKNGKFMEISSRKPRLKLGTKIKCIVCPVQP